ncbi:TPA: hypothetical protein N2D99_001980 [Clostridium botulinum]|nr:hypothetical protein [Clostridium botulinum]
MEIYKAKRIILFGSLLCVFIFFSLSLLEYGVKKLTSDTCLPDGKYRIEGFSVARPTNTKNSELYIIVTNKAGTYYYVTVGKNIKKENMEEMSIGNYLYMNNNRGIIKK